MKKIIEIEKLQEILDELGEIPVKHGFKIVNKMILMIEQSPNYVEPIVEPIVEKIESNIFIE